MATNNNEFLRENRRAVLFINAELFHKGKLHSQALVKDLSIDGAKVFSNEIKNPEKLTLKIYYIHSGAPLELECKLQWAKLNLLGLHFRKLSKKNKIILKALIRYHAADEAA